MRPQATFSFFIFSHAEATLYERVSVRRLVGWLVTFSSKISEINIFEQIVDRGSMLGSLDAS